MSSVSACFATSGDSHIRRDNKFYTMSTHDLLQTEAVLDDEEDESFGEEGGQDKGQEENGHYDDSSDEELDDEDEDAVRAVRALSPCLPCGYQQS